jgi:hypothetical protein
MKRLLALVGALLGVVYGVRADATLFGSVDLRALSHAITEIDLERAQRLAKSSANDTPQFMLERARLLVYLGDCVGAAALLENPAVTESKEGAQLAEIARSCARATAAGFVIEDAQRGIWLRVQDDADRVFAPFVFDVAQRARDRIGENLGVDLPRPLRIDLVRDLFSLSAVTGLPLEAAETTGTLAVARFGRIIMLSPRATRSGYHWEDTLAHEITHLLVTRATRDRGPLWLQEGVAKREESRWREARPFDKPHWSDDTAARALRQGRSVGIDKLGPSIAMLPSPEAASTAYAEVHSFIEYFVKEAGEPALRLLFADLKGLGSDDENEALRGATGYDLRAWNRRWQAALIATKHGLAAEGAREPRAGDRHELSRKARLSDLLLQAGFGNEVALSLTPVPVTREPSFRFRVARAELARGQPDAAKSALGAETEIDGVYGPWFALQGRALEQQDRGAAERSFQLGLAFDPLAEEPACEGRFSVGSKPDDPHLPAQPERRALCEEARKLPRD